MEQFEKLHENIKINQQINQNHCHWDCFVAFGSSFFYNIIFYSSSYYPEQEFLCFNNVKRNLRLGALT